jgi:hypothetical protein
VISITMAQLAASSTSSDPVRPASSSLWIIRTISVKRAVCGTVLRTLSVSGCT